MCTEEHTYKPFELKNSSPEEKTRGDKNIFTETEGIMYVLSQVKDLH
jgi:hypothetical protein